MKTPLTYHEWVKLTFTWVDNDLKRYMQRAWTASTKAANKRNEDKLKALKGENAKLKGDVEKMGALLKKALDEYAFHEKQAIDRQQRTKQASYKHAQQAIQSVLQVAGITL